MDLLMDYLPARLLRPAKLSEVSGPAIVLPDPGRDDAFLVTGGDQPYVCFIEGNYVGDGFLKREAARWSGIAIEGVNFEVDRTSAFQPALIDQPLGALIRSGTELQVFVGAKERYGFREATRAALAADLPASSDNSEMGFTRWRAVIHDGLRQISVFTYEATKTANV
jgi:hypothetical protein